MQHGPAPPFVFISSVSHEWPSHRRGRGRVYPAVNKAKGNRPRYTEIRNKNPQYSTNKRTVSSVVHALVLVLALFDITLLLPRNCQGFEEKSGRPALSERALKNEEKKPFSGRQTAKKPRRESKQNNSPCWSLYDGERPRCRRRSHRYASNAAASDLYRHRCLAYSHC